MGLGKTLQVISVLNSAAELWSIFDFIMPGYLYNYNKFKKKFEEPILKQEDKEALVKLKRLISPFVLRRVKKDVLTELPEKNITVLKNEMEKEFNKLGIKYYKLVGNTPVNKRVKMVDEFNDDSSIKVFLISLKAGGTGLNLTSADIVIHYDPWWNISAENQVTDRAYRIGQKNSVQLYKLITSNSIEEKINKMQEKKEKLSKDILSTKETFVNKLSKQELLDLFD